MTKLITITPENSYLDTSLLSKYSLGSNTAITSSDTIHSAFGKAQGQINARALLAGNILQPFQTSTLTMNGALSGATTITALSTISALGGNSTQWNTAYGWGNHAGLYIPTGGLGLMSDNLYSSTDTTTSSNFRTSIFGSSTSGNQIKAWRWNNVPPLLTGKIGAYGTALVWAGAETHGFLGVEYTSGAEPKAVIGGGNIDTIKWTANLIH